MITKFITKVSVLLLIVVLLVPSAVAEEPSTILKPIVNGNTAFALDLYSVLRKQDKNIFFSPYSISSALAMTYGGAVGGTAEEIGKTLHFPPGADKTHLAFGNLNRALEGIQNKGNNQLSIANSLWPQKNYHFVPEYLNLIRKSYEAAVMPVDYKADPQGAMKAINGWVDKKTKGKIKDIINSIDNRAVLTLVNAIYFKGSWAHKFDPKLTKQTKFFSLNGRKAQVPMMGIEKEFKYCEIKNAQLLELPYFGEQLSMILILPSDPSKLSSLEAQLTPKNLDSWLSGMWSHRVNVYLPKFKLAWDADLKDPLYARGMRKAFDEKAADFSKMAKFAGTNRIHISRILHKAFVEVNEEGTEATAATAVIMPAGSSQPPRVFTFRADHPFLFMIRDNSTGSILFMGRIIDPGAPST